MLKKVRRKVAGWLLGNETALFLPKDAIAKLENRDYLSLSDEQLAAVTRRWFSAITSVIEEEANQKNIPVTVMQNEYAVLGLAKFLKDVNADTASLSVRGTIDGGKTTEDFFVDIKRLPHDPERWTEPLGMTTKVEEDGRITEMHFRYSHDEGA